jgi:hypothetical protein
LGYFRNLGAIRGTLSGVSLVIRVHTSTLYWQPPIFTMAVRVEPLPALARLFLAELMGTTFDIFVMNTRSLAIGPRCKAEPA